MGFFLGEVGLNPYFYFLFFKFGFDQLGRTPPPTPYPQVGTQNFEFFTHFFILMDTKHFKMDFSMKNFFLYFSSLPSFPYYSQPQNCTIPTII